MSDPTSRGSAEVPRYRIALSKVTSLGVFTRRSSTAYTGSLAELETIYRKVLHHNLLAGWWGIPFGVVWTPMVLMANRRAMVKLRGTAAGSPEVPGNS
jgi:hypothetical protein